MVNTPGVSIARQMLLRLLIAFGLIAGVLFGTAGRFDLPFVWAFLAVFFGIGGLGVALVFRRHASLLQERMKPSEEGRDRYTRPVAQTGALLCLLLAAWDAGRAHWSVVPPWVQVTALTVLGATMSMWMWAMASNPFFSAVVRVQRDRGHAVVSTGPYRWVRHPGYAAALLMFLAIPLTLGSWWALLPMLPVMAIFTWRTKLEDGMLHAELEGYAGYASRVRFRLVPGVW